MWAANGSNEIQQQLLQVFGGPGRSALGFTPAYSMHPLLAAGTGTRWIDGRRDADFELDRPAGRREVEEHRPDVVFLCSPNNPTGTALDLAVVRAVLDAAPGMVVVDEAYAEFARPGTPQRVDPAAGYPRLVVTRTMSKAFGFAGGRVGYLAANPAVVEAVQLVRLPYHLSTLTQAAARAVLAHRDLLLSTVEVIKEQRDRIVRTLRERGHRVADSDANFVLFEVGGDQRVVWQALLDRGVLVRDVGLPGWLRVTAGTPEETDAFLRAMVEIARERRSEVSSMSRAARVERTTAETKVLVELELDGAGRAEISTGIGFFDHMLNQIARHGGFDLVVRTVGDLEIDAHHTIEDTALALGAAFAQALGDKAGIRRYGGDGADGRGAGAGRGRPVRSAVHGARRAAARPVHRPGVPDQHDPAHLGVVRTLGPNHAARRRPAGGAPGQPAGRPPRGGGAVQGGRPRAAGGGRDRPARGGCGAEHQGGAVR